MTSVLFEGSAIVTVDDSNSVLDPGWIFIRNDIIENIGKGQTPKNIRKEADEIIDASGSAIMPGMVNGHTHLFQTFFRGLADDKPLLDWLEECIWPGASELDADTAKTAATLGLIENLRGGATTVVDHQYIHIDPQIDDAVCQAASEAGLRFILASGWADRNYHPPLTESSQKVISRINPVYEKWHGAENNRIQVGLAPLIPWGCSDEAMTETVATTRAWGGSTHLHCAETEIEVEMNIKERGLRHVHWLESLGLLGPDIQLAHAIWLDEDEIDLISKRGASVVHCPVSNMYLASGVAKIKEMLDRGITVALGSLEVGKKADLIVVDLMTPFSAPVHRVASAIVFCATPRDVIHVMVDGKLLIRNREITFTNEKKAIARATECAEKIFQKAGIASRLL